MSEEFLCEGSRIMVAIGDNGRDAELISGAVELAKLTRSQLHLVHVFEHPITDYLRAILPMNLIRPEIILDSERDAVHGVASRLEEWVQRVDVQTTTNVIMGSRIEALVAEAHAIKPALIVVGVNRAESPTLEGWSTAYGLMHRSQVPILALPSADGIEPGVKGLRILISDDLREGSLTAIKVGLRLAAVTAAAEVCHFAVNELTRGTFMANLDRTLRKSPEGGLSSAQIFDAIEAELRERLQIRGAAQKEFLQAAGCNVSLVLRQGDVLEALSLECEQMKPNILVFGRHHDFYSTPVKFGKLPLRAMVSFHLPALIAPERFEE